MLPIFYINLESRPDRRDFMEAQFEALGLQATRIEAVSRSSLSTEQVDKYCNPNHRWSMTKGRYACNLSHLRAWDALAASGQQRGLILEDDAVLSTELPRFLEALERSTDKTSLIRIEKFGDRVHYYRAVDSWITPDIGLRECLSHDIGAAGYIIASRAIDWLRLEPTFHTRLIDDFLFTPFSDIGWKLDVRYTDPALCMQIGTEHAAQIGSSDLNGGEDAVHKAARKQRPLVKFSRHLEIWVREDIPRGVLETAARVRWRAERRELTLRR